MPIPPPSEAHPILAHERAVWIRGADDYGPGSFGVCSFIGRNAARPYALSHVFAAAGLFTYAALYTPNPMVYSALRLLAADVALESCSAAAIVSVQLCVINSAPTGGTAIAARSLSVFATSPPTLGMVLPTGGAGVLTVASMLEYNLGVTGAVPATNPPPVVAPQALWPLNPAIPILKAPQATTASSGWAIRVEVSAACTVNLLARFLFSEDP